MKNALYFTLKALFVLKIFKFCLDFLGMYDEVNFKAYDVISWLTSNAIQLLPNVSRSKDNRAMEFGQLIE